MRSTMLVPRLLREWCGSGCGMAGCGARVRKHSCFGFSFRFSSLVRFTNIPVYRFRFRFISTNSSSHTSIHPSLPCPSNPLPCSDTSPPPAHSLATHSSWRHAPHCSFAPCLITPDTPHRRFRRLSRRLPISSALSSLLLCVVYGPRGPRTNMFVVISRRAYR